MILDKQHHGIVAPLFSLRSAVSGGIGEFHDLIPLIDWCKEVGFDIIQLLPLNDSTPDASPYNALSAFALNPIHLSLYKLPLLDRELQEEITKLQEKSRPQWIPYHEIREAKDRIFEKYNEKVGGEIRESVDYKSFIAKHASWLDPYAKFRTLKRRHGWRSWESFSEEVLDGDPELDLYRLMQFFCFQEWQEVKRHAEESGVFLKGDLPILVSRESTDVWLHPENFHMELSAGAPPDMYNPEGQSWGSPPYNWESPNADLWWKERLRVAGELYHLYRIDHIIGFFRIFAMRSFEKPRDGHFYPDEFNRCLIEGEKRLKMLLESSPLLPIGEDLGMVPPEVRQCMQRLGIPGTKVMRWERHWQGDGSYIDPKEYPPLSMTTVSTHDSEPLQLWLGKELTPEKRYEILRDSHHSGSLFHINLLSEYLDLIPEMCFENPEDERINVPGTVNDRNWCVRLKPTLEEFTHHEELKKLIKSLTFT